jgi:hypothetical protein
MNQQAVDKIKAERDAAIRERDGWKTECEMAMAKIAAMEKIGYALKEDLSDLDALKGVQGVGL